MLWMISTMKFTPYFQFARKRPDRVQIKLEWIQQVVDSPEKQELQNDGRIKKWGYIKEKDKYLRVILLPDGKTIHNAFFDRSYKSWKLNTLQTQIQPL